MGYSDYSQEDLEYDPVPESVRVESDTLDPPGPLNLRGSIRRRLALDAALASPEQSLVCSPISALLPLGKLALGATGKCLKQALDAIGLSMLSQLDEAFKPLLNDLAFLNGVTLNVISKIYVSNEHSLKSIFENNAKEIFKTSVEVVTFKSPHTVARHINNWVSSKTQNMIPNIIADSDISPWTSLLLINAVYFSGKWAESFEKVMEKMFYTPSGTRKVPMMIREGTYNYSKSDALDAQIIEIPYEGKETSFVIILPNTKNGLSIMMEKIRLAPELMQKAVAKLVPTDIVLNIPKFKTSSEVDLIVAYKKLGVTDIFQKDASGLENIVSGAENIYVSKAVQKAVFEVSEQGTKGAASSVLQAVPLSLIYNKKKFKANHPFMYYIKFKDEQLFSGIFVN